MLQWDDLIIFPISQVDIKGNFARSQRKALEKIINPIAKQGFFGVDLKEVQARIQALPGISQVQVRRG